MPTITITATPSGVPGLLDITVAPTQLHLDAARDKQLRWICPGGRLTRVEFHSAVLTRGKSPGPTFEDDVRAGVPSGTYSYRLAGTFNGSSFEILNCPEIIIE